LRSATTLLWTGRTSVAARASPHSRYKLVAPLLAESAAE
jgi:hypothetical protein